MNETLVSMPETDQSPIFEHRAGQQVERYLTILEQEPVSPLNETQKNNVLNFESDLMQGYYSVTDSEEYVFLPQGESLAELINSTGYSANKFELRTEFIAQDAIIRNLCEQNGILDIFLQDPSKAVAVLSFGCNAKTLKEAQGRSEAYFQNLMNQYVFESGEKPSTDRIIVFNDATKLFQRTRGLVDYKRFLTSVYRDIKAKATTTNDVESQAKQSIARIYMKRVNHELATIMPDLIDFRTQAEKMPEPQKSLLIQSLEHVWGLFHRIDFSEDEELKKRLIVRLDHLRNGASQSEDASVGVVSAELKEYFESYDSQEQGQDLQPIFTPEETKKLALIRFDADKMAQFCKEILGSFGKLSVEDEDTYYPDRPHRAQDEKWQIIKREGTSAMGAEDPEGVLEIPISFNRNLTEQNPPAGVISGAAHEIMHIFQRDNIKQNSNGLRLARELSGKGSVVLAEAGAILIERQVQAILFGQQRADNPHYLRAMNEFESSDDEIAAIQAFFESYMAQNPQANAGRALTDAISRVKRLTRRKGGFDSQALNYAETALIAEKLSQCSPKVVNLLMAEGAYSLQDLATLHSFGLAESSPELFPVDNYIQLVVQKFKTLVTENQENL